MYVFGSVRWNDQMLPDLYVEKKSNPHNTHTRHTYMCRQKKVNDRKKINSHWNWCMMMRLCRHWVFFFSYFSDFYIAIAISVCIFFSVFVCKNGKKTWNVIVECIRSNIKVEKIKLQNRKIYILQAITGYWQKYTM